MRSTTRAAFALGLVAPTLGLPRAVNVGALLPDLEKAAAVKDAFRISWAGYYEYAFPNDDLRPNSNGFDNDRNGWGATAIDGLSTAIIMREVETVNTILKFVPTINFNTTAVANQGVSVFETTIRYLGGMIASYDLLTGPYSSLGVDPDLVHNLLTQAETLAESLKVAFDTPSGVPEGTVFLNPTKHNGGSGLNNIAEIGTLVLEWTRLSDLTGNQEYAQLAQKGESYLIKPRGVPEAFPGLIGTWVSTGNGSFLDNSGSWNGGDDSFYEYLIKMYLYNPEVFATYKDRWVLAADSTIAHLASHPTTRQDLTFLAQFSGHQISPNSGHLASFAGGNFILGGTLLGVPEYVDFGLTLSESYFETYIQTASGIGPEGFRWADDALPASANNTLPTPEKEAFYDKAGFWSTSAAYILRPETMESLWYSWRATGDAKYREMAWEGFLAINRTTRAGSGYSSIFDVTEADGGGFYDSMESFWFAETLKYMYLIFGEQDSPVQFQGGAPNSFVFNTEAQPMRVLDS